MAPLRVVVVAPWGERLGGAEEMLWLALKRCDRRRLEPTVVFLGPGPFVEEVAALGIGTEVIPAGRLRRPGAVLGTVRALAAVLRRSRPDLVVGWSAKTQIYGAPAAALAGLAGRVVWWQHQIPDGHWVNRVATLLPARAIGCSSEACRRAQATLRPRRPAFVVNPGIEAEAGHSGDPDGLRARLGIPQAARSPGSSAGCSRGRARTASSRPSPSCASAASTSTACWSAATPTAAPPSTPPGSSAWSPSWGSRAG